MAIEYSGKKIVRVVGFLTPILLITLFLLFPVFSVLIYGFVDESGFTFQYLGKVFSNGYYYKLFAFTLSQALLSTIVSLLIGIPLGYFFGKYEFTGRKILLTLFTVPFVLPSVLVGMGFLNIFSENGLFGIPLLSIIMAHAFYNIPLVIHYFVAYYRNFDRDLIDAAKTMKSNSTHSFFRIYLPLFLQPILTAAMLTFNFCFLSFGIILMLGTPGNYRSVEVEINSSYFTGETNLAAALAIMQLIITIAYVVGYLLLMRRNSKQKKTSNTAVFPRTQLEFKTFFRKFSGWLLAFCFLAGLTLELAPMISILINSFIKTSTGQFTFENYAAIFSLERNSYLGTSIPRTILNTLLFAIGSACFATILAIIIGIPLGIVSGYFGGRIDRYLTLIADSIYSLPSKLKIRDSQFLILNS